MVQKASIAALFLPITVLLLFNAGSGSFLNHDEITYLQMAREMVQTGNYLDLQFQGEVVHQRPPLAIWLLALSRGAFGSGLLASRLPAIAMGLCSLIALFLLARCLYTERVAYLAVGLATASMLFYFNARRPMTDTTFLAGMLCFFYFYRQAREKPALWVAAGAAAGWMLMSKGALSALPLAVALVDHFTSGGKGRNAAVAAGSAFILSAPWHIIQWIRHGNAFWSEYIGFNVLSRSSGSLFTQNDPLLYFRELWLNEGPTALLLAGGVAALSWRWLRQRQSTDRFLLLWLALVFLPLQFSSTRIYHYLLPVLPALVLSVASGIAPLLEKRTLQAGATVVIAALFFLANSHHMLTPDYSPDQLLFARQIASPESNTSKMADGKVFALNTYELSLFYYLNEPVEMLTDNQNFFKVVDSAPLLHRTSSARLVSRDQLTRMIANDPFHCLTTKQHLPLICGNDGTLCGGDGPYRVTDGKIVVLVSSRTR